MTHHAATTAWEALDPKVRSASVFTDKKSVQQLVLLMISHGIKEVVLCPGSRDIPLIHTVVNSGAFKTYSITDERSAGFFALGRALESGQAVAVIVTSGSALLNLHPAVSEAFYQQVPLLVISADRPFSWIGQMDGQTLPQSDVFKTLVRKSVSLPEVTADNSDEAWFCNRLINEALLELNHHVCGPVHINVPISDPFFEFASPLQAAYTATLPQAQAQEQLQPQAKTKTKTKAKSKAKSQQQVPELQQSSLERVICRYDAFTMPQLCPESQDSTTSDDERALSVAALRTTLRDYHVIMMVVGQETIFDHSLQSAQTQRAVQALKALAASGVIIVAENLANLERNGIECCPMGALDLLLAVQGGVPADDGLPRPDVVITLSGHIISKPLKRFLRSQKVEHWQVSPNGEIADLFGTLSTVLELPNHYFLQLLQEALQSADSYIDTDITAQRKILCERLVAKLQSIVQVRDEVSQDSDYSQRYAVVSFLDAVASMKAQPNWPEITVHLANSSAVRYAQQSAYSQFKEQLLSFCANRGVNGIEGSLSTALGYAAGCQQRLNFILIGDLSFFYDMNALAQEYIGNNVCIVLFNNYGGEIFRVLPQLNLNEDTFKYVTATHQLTAKAWAESRGFDYSEIHNLTALELINIMLPRWCRSDISAPRFIEVFTDSKRDAKELKKFQQQVLAYI